MTSVTSQVAEAADPDDGGVAARLERVRARVAEAARAAGRDPADVAIVAVSKGQPMTAVAAAADAGQRMFGERRARALDRRARERPDLAWHMIGRLQTNKVKYVVGCALVHSVDRDDLVDALDRRAGHDDVVQDVLVQVNVDGDPAKAGYAPDDVGAALDRVARCERLRLTGLMTIPALSSDPQPVFAALRDLRDTHARTHAGLVHLSMGMSADLEAAVAQGATLVRPGTAVFGPRPGASDADDDVPSVAADDARGRGG